MSETRGSDNYRIRCFGYGKLEKIKERPCRIVHIAENYAPCLPALNFPPT